LTHGATLANVGVIVLAGGLGRRLRAVTGDRPKVLVRVGGRPFIEHVLLQLQNSGLKDVVLSTGFGAAAVEELLGTGRHLGMRLRYCRETHPLGTGGALRLACTMLGMGPMLVLNGDSLVRTDLTVLLREHLHNPAIATLLLAEVPDRSRFGAVSIDESGRIVQFKEKGVAGGGLVNAGAYVIEREMLVSCPTNRAVSLEYELLPALVGRIRGLAVSSALVDIGTPEALLAAQHYWGT
jgi:NDP-sugar pyrophosphorylase family protein